MLATYKHAEVLSLSSLPCALVALYVLLCLHTS